MTPETGKCLRFEGLKKSVLSERQSGPQMRLEMEAVQTVQGLVGRIRDFRFHPECMGINLLYVSQSTKICMISPPCPQKRGLSLSLSMTFTFYIFSTYLVFH